MSSQKERFKASLPSRPYCTDSPTNGVYREPKCDALKRRLIQTNSDNFVRWMWFDVDHEDAWFRPEERGLPAPTMTVINPSNAHAHIGYELEAPVSLSSSSHQAPIELLLAVQRGITARLGADQGYSHTLSKNPLNGAWETDWQGQRPYDLLRLNDYLSSKDKRIVRRGSVAGLGRNCTIFEDLRQIAYRHVLKSKKSGETLEQFRKFLEGAATVMNCSFQNPLMAVEVLGIAKSVSKWAWERFSFERFSAIQSARAKRRWAKYGTPLSTSKPWEAEGISESTWRRRRALNP